MGFLSDLVGSFTGSTGRDAARAQMDAAKQGQTYVREAANQARGEVKDAFGQAATDQAAGFQGAMDLFSNMAPQTAGTYQQGNMQAQQSLLAGLPQMQNAILGAPVDYSGFQPQQVSFNPSFLQGQQAIGYQSPEDLAAQQAAQDPLAGQSLAGLLGNGNISLDQYFNAGGGKGFERKFGWRNP